VPPKRGTPSSVGPARELSTRNDAQASRLSSCDMSDEALARKCQLAIVSVSVVVSRMARPGHGWLVPEGWSEPAGRGAEQSLDLIGGPRRVK
jgi:hypothetical protein